MAENSEKEPASPIADQRSTTASNKRFAATRSQEAAGYGGYALAFLLGCIATVGIHYMLRGNSVQLTPENFVSLVFTIAVGGASLVLAIAAINYGRVSERVMTERADRSIDLQMSLFQKSLDLQTQLFDKTMSTLESIGRSTGVTDQRLGDMHSYMQSPAFLKQIAGRAVEQTTSELSTSGKAGVQEGEFEAHLAERLTKNIVEELSARWESFRPAPTGTVPLQSLSSLANPSSVVVPMPPEESFDEQARRYESRLNVQNLRKRLQERLEKAISSIQDATLKPSDGSLRRLWENMISYKGKTIATDLRAAGGKPTQDMTTYDTSIRNLFSHPEVDCLVFVFGGPASDVVKAHLDKRNAQMGKRVRYVVEDDQRQLQDDLLAVLESIAAELPSTG